MEQSDLARWMRMNVHNVVVYDRKINGEGPDSLSPSWGKVASIPRLELALKLISPPYCPGHPAVAAKERSGAQRRPHNQGPVPGAVTPTAMLLWVACTRA